MATFASPIKDTTPADLTAVQEENESLNSALRLTEEFAKLIKGHKSICHRRLCEKNN